MRLLAHSPACRKVATLWSGPYGFTITYAGGADGNNVVVTLTQVLQYSTSVALASDHPSGSVYGQAGTFTATVSATAASGVTPTGSVQFLVDGNNYGTPVSLVAGSGTVMASLPAGTHTVAANYTSDDPSFASSDSAPLSAIVSPATLTITANDDSKTYGTLKTFAATAFTETGLVTGTGDTLTGVMETSTASPASATVGAYDIVASAATGTGLGNYCVSYVDGTLTVNKATPTIVLTPYSVTYDGNAHAATGAATGVNGESLAGLNLSGTTHTNPGTYVDTWTFTDFTGNYNNASGTVTDSISAVGSIIVLDHTAGGALTLSGNASINVPGVIYVDSGSSSALSVSGNAGLEASSIDVVGKVQKSGNASFSPAPVTGAAVAADPLASLPLPGAPSLANDGSKSVSGNSVATIGPGIYSQISVSGNGQLTMTAGTYMIGSGGFTASGNAVIKLGAGSYILDGSGLSISGNAALSGAGVTIFNVGSSYNPATGYDDGSFGAVTFSGSGAESLTPPTSGTYAGILLYQARDNAKALTLSGNAMQGLSGTIYAAAAQLTESGNAQIGTASNPISIIVDTMSISGNAVANAQLDARPWEPSHLPRPRFAPPIGSTASRSTAAARPLPSSMLTTIRASAWPWTRLIRSSG